jgi:hypothetical protein
MIIMPRHRLPLACLLVLLISAGAARAHQVPNMTIEATFESAGTFELKVNLDPRVFLSTIPTSLPPVVAEWYLNQTPEQVQATYAQATEHLKKHVEARFGGVAASLAEISWQAMDGTTNLPVTQETTETHLLGTLRGKVPVGQGEFALSFAREAQVSLILLLKIPEMAEPKVQVLFPGETSRAIQVPTKVKVVAATPPAAPSQWPIWLGAGLVAALAAVWLLRTMR